MSTEPRGLAADLSWGAVAGTLATFALSATSSALYARENKFSKAREEWARGGKTANRVAVDRLARAAGVDLSGGQTAAAEGALHFGIGAGAGAVYGVVRSRVPGPSLAKGLGFGASLWLVADEGLNPALGLVPGPTAFPWQAHARGLVAHLAFGLATEGLLAIADRFRRPARA